ncbi:single-stranded DNA-binding protein [Rummeliibacillus stabekisii]|uniref:single-stranded DNA-binding protein n=1 Tax=Rummeliibacillus stabekisii TaxID=241244 RepID=UPI00371DACD1
MNNMNITGRLTSDLELKYTNGKNVPYVRFTVAVNRKRKVEGRPTADFFNVLLWREAANNAAKYLGKGSLVAVSGPVETGSFTNQQNQKVPTFEIVDAEVTYLDSRKNNTETQNNTQPNNSGQSNNWNQGHSEQQQYSGNQGGYPSGQPPVNYGYERNGTVEDDLPF